MDSKGNTFKIVVLVVLLICFVVMGYLLMKNQDQEATLVNIEKELDREREKVENLVQDKKDLNKTVDNKNIEIEGLNENIADKESNIRDLNIEKEVLERDKTQLDNNIKEIREKMLALQDEDPDGKFRTIQEQFEKLMAEKEALVSAITSRDSTIAAYKTEIGRYIQDRTRLRQDSVNLSYRVDSLYYVVQNRDSVYVRYQKDMELVQDIVENTRIIPKGLQLSEDEDGGGRVKKFNRDNQKDKWKYTTVSFEMNHPEMIIDGENFAIRLFDLDTNTPIELRDKNPVEVSSKSAFLDFKKSNQSPIELTHYNHQNKRGDNYEIQVFFVLKGKEYMIAGGKIPVIKNGKIEGY
ncbi:MAG: hypothetical protein ACI8PD_001393 [Nitrospinales bacterium]|jgi:hypothetical protein